MATGEIVGRILEIMPPGSDFASRDWVVGGSTPAENYPVYDFDAAADEYIDFLCYCDGYDGGGLTITVPWSSSAATSWPLALPPQPLRDRLRPKAMRIISSLGFMVFLPEFE